MNKKLLFLPLAAMMAFASCSNDEPANNGSNSNGETSFLAVNIVTPKGTRAAGYEVGAGNENTVNDAAFILLDKDKKVTQVIDNVSLETWDGPGDFNGTVEKISSSVLVINGEESNDSEYILAVLNKPSHGIKQGDSWQTVKAKAGNYDACQGNAGDFTMTNSVYSDIVATPIANKLAKSETAALAQPAEIFVERTVAKIRTSIEDGNKDNFSNASVKVIIDGQEKTLKIDIKSVDIANVARTSYLFKNIDNISYSWLNDPTNHRSYWANIPANMQYDNKCWKDAGRNVLNTQNFYVQENVADLSSNPVRNTSVLLRAQLVDENDQPVSFVKVGDRFLSMEGGLTYIANVLANVHRYYIKDESNTAENVYKSIPVDYLEWASSADASMKYWEGYARLKADKAGTKFYIYQNNSFHERSAAEVNASLKDQRSRVLVWNNGMTTYFMDINHDRTGADGKQLKGVIRNHVYDLNLKDISGVGVPVFDPNTVIVPEKPNDDNLFYLAAKVNILQWRLVKQDVSFDF